MKTTFKAVFNEIDDDLMNIDFQENNSADIDIGKIKSEVFKQIKDDKTGKKKLSKKFIVFLVAAVIFVCGTVGTFATGTIQSIFKGYFKGSEVNYLGLYDGGVVDVKSDDYNVKLLGIMSDGEIAYSAMEVTRKDGSPMFEDGYYINNELDTFVFNRYEFTFDGEKQAQGEGAISRSRCSLSDDRKTLSIYTDFTRGSKTGHDLKDFRVTYNNRIINGYKLDKVLYTTDLPEVQSGSEESAEERGKRENEEMNLEKLRKENGLTEDECMWIHHDGKLVYAQGEEKQYDLSFTISFDFDRSVDDLIEREINTENAPNIVCGHTRNAKIIISPLGISLSGECDKKIDERKKSWECRCFNCPDTDGKSKVILDDGTVYYILVNVGGERKTDDNGIFHETTHLQYSATKEMPYNLGSNRIIIDLDKVQSVIINGDTVYQK